MPSTSKTQQRFMGMVHATQKGYIKAPSPSIASTAKEMKPSDTTHFAKTKHKGLPEHVKKNKKTKEAFVQGFADRASYHGLTVQQTMQILKNSELSQLLQDE